MPRHPFRLAATRSTLTALGALLLAGALVVAGPASAQDRKPAQASGGKSAGKAAGGAPTGGRAAGAAAMADDKVIAPFIGENTFIVGRLDVARVDADAIEQQLNKIFDEAAKMEGADAAEIKEGRAEAAEGMKKLREGLAQFIAAGGQRVSAVVDSDALMGGGGPVLVTPLGKGADAKKLTDLFAKMDNSGQSTSAQVGGALVVAAQPQIDSLKQRFEAAAGGGKPAEGAARPDLAKAFAAAGNAPLRVSLVPGDAARQFVEQSVTELPQEIGGGDPKLISQGIRWLTMAVNQKPMGMTLTLQAADEESAKGLMDIVNKGVEFARAQPAPNGDAEAWAKQLEKIRPKLQGQTITMTIDASVMQMGVVGTRVEGEIDAGGDDAAPADPAKPDDGGL